MPPTPGSPAPRRARSPAAPRERDARPARERRGLVPAGGVWAWPIVARPWGGRRRPVLPLAVGERLPVRVRAHWAIPSEETVNDDAALMTSDPAVATQRKCQSLARSDPRHHPVASPRPRAVTGWERDVLIGARFAGP